MSKNYTIFVNQPSPYMTDCEPHGDGLLAYQYISRLAQRGHHLYIAAPLVKLREPLPPNVHLFLVKTITRPSWYYPSWLHRFEYALRVKSIFNRLQRNISFDVIHQLNPITLGVNLFLPANGIPLVIGPGSPWWLMKESASCHGIYAKCRFIFNRFLKWELFRRTQRILVPVLSSGGFSSISPAIRKRVRLLHFGIDTQQFAPESSSSSLERFIPNVLYLGNLYKAKGIYDLLHAFEIVIKSVPQARLTIVGDGPEREGVKQEISAMSASNRIVMLGAIAHEKAAEVIRDCSVFCLPSYGELFGMSVLEAMSCGKPVVTTAVGGLDYLVDEQCGIKVSVGNPEELAAALIRLLTNHPLCAQMGNHNRELAVSEYDWDRVISNLEHIYEQVIQS